MQSLATQSRNESAFDLKRLVMMSLFFNKTLMVGEREEGSNNRLVLTGRLIASSC